MESHHPVSKAHPHRQPTRTANEHGHDTQNKHGGTRKAAPSCKAPYPEFNDRVKGLNNISNKQMHMMIRKSLLNIMCSAVPSRNRVLTTTSTVDRLRNPRLKPILRAEAQNRQEGEWHHHQHDLKSSRVTGPVAPISRIRSHCLNKSSSPFKVTTTHTTQCIPNSFQPTPGPPADRKASASAFSAVDDQRSMLEGLKRMERHEQEPIIRDVSKTSEFLLTLTPLSLTFLNSRQPRTRPKRSTSNRLSNSSGPSLSAKKGLHCQMR